MTEPFPRTFLLSYLIVSVAAGAYVGPAFAQTPTEHGSYLVNTILACGNCHTPKAPDGSPAAAKELSGGGLTFTTPAFNTTAANFTPDRETGIGNWTDAEIKRALTDGTRPLHARGGAPLAAVMPANFYKAILPSDLDAIVS